MERFDYAISKHAADMFNQVVYFCSETAECGLREVPGDQIKIPAEVLNEKGQRGWELIQVAFGSTGVRHIFAPWTNQPKTTKTERPSPCWDLI